MDGRELRVQMARYGRPTEPSYRRSSSRRSGRRRYILFCMVRHCRLNLLNQQLNNLVIMLIVQATRFPFLVMCILYIYS